MSDTFIYPEADELWRVINPQHAYAFTLKDNKLADAAEFVNDKAVFLVVEVERRRLVPGSIAVTVMFGQEPGIIFTTCKAIERVS